MGGSPGKLREELVTYEKRKKGWRINCDVGEAMEVLENELDVGEATERLEKELWRMWSDGKVGEWAELMGGSPVELSEELVT